MQVYSGVSHNGWQINFSKVSLMRDFSILLQIYKMVVFLNIFITVPRTIFSQYLWLKLYQKNGAGRDIMFLDRRAQLKVIPTKKMTWGCFLGVEDSQEG